MKKKNKVNPNSIFEEEAAQLLEKIGKWVELKSTFPSPYKSILEATRSFLEDFKNGKIKVEPKKINKLVPLPLETEDD